MTVTRAFERFLRSFSDDDLRAFAKEQVEKRPPYRRLLEIALRIELDRRELSLDMGPTSASTEGCQYGSDDPATDGRS